MEWNVYRHDFNNNSIKIFNVFNHYYFEEDVLKILKNKKLDRNEFTEKLKRSAMYYFWSKSEHEVVITSFPPYITKEELDRLSREECKYRCSLTLETGEKVDIYQQLLLNWDRFIDYVWSFRKKENK